MLPPRRCRPCVAVSPMMGSPPAPIRPHPTLLHLKWSNDIIISYVYLSWGGSKLAWQTACAGRWRRRWWTPAGRPPAGPPTGSSSHHWCNIWNWGEYFKLATESSTSKKNKHMQQTNFPNNCNKQYPHPLMSLSGHIRQIRNSHLQC